MSRAGFPGPSSIISRKYKAAKKRILIIAAVLLAASLGFALVANAEEAKGTGTLEAHGDGLAALHGAGWMRVGGNGVLWVKGAKNINIEGRGHKKVFPDGWTEYVGFNGVAGIQGRDMSVILAGEEIGLYAILWGEGRYRINKLITGTWSETIEVLSY